MEKAINTIMFYERLAGVDRIWHEGEGISLKQASSYEILSDICYIFVRDDGWSIGCSEEDKQECEGLWSDQWEEIFKKESTHPYRPINRCK